MQDHTIDNTANTKPDEYYLAQFELRCELLRDRTVSVAKRYQNGLHVVGRPGSGKTKIITDTLQKLQTPHVYRNGRMSPMGLYQQLESHPEHVIVIDDIPSLLTERMAVQILMAALGGDPGQGRPLTYSTKSSDEHGKCFDYYGGVIAVSNVPLRRDPLTDALASRSVLLQHDPSDEELAAVMRERARQGHKDISPAQCREVVDFVVSECASNDYRLDLRHMMKGFQDYRQQLHGEAHRPWQELIRSSMKEIHRESPPVFVSKQAQLRRDEEVVKHVIEKYPDDPQKQLAESGFKKSKFYELKKLATASHAA